MKKLINNIILITYSILIFLVLLSSTFYIIKNETILPIITLILTLTIFILLKKIQPHKTIQLNKKTIILLILFGILIRILLLFLNYKNVYSDEATFYYNAVNLANNTNINTRYIAVFPYLYSYILLLGSIMNFIGTGFKTVVLTNILLDMIGSYFIYLIGNKLKNKELGIKMMLLWLYNPLQILWCTKALPVIIVNTLFIICIYTFIILLKSDTIKKKITLSIILGILLGISNSFRPIFIIFLIAMICYYIYNLLIKENKTDIKLINLIIIIIIFITCNNFYSSLVSSKTNYKIGNNTSGWTLYLGSNLKSNGAWFEVSEFNEFLNSNEDEFDVQEIHNYFKEQAINNYKTYSILNLTKLFTKKYYILTSNIPSYTYENTINPLTNNKLTIICKLYLIIFWITLILNCITIKIKNIKNPIIIFLIILEIGLILSHLLVEVSPRYFIPLTVPLLLISKLEKSNKHIKVSQ